MSLQNLNFRRLVGLCALFAGLASSSSLPYIKRHSLPSIPTGWTLHEEIPSAETLITLQIGLKQHRIGTLIKALYEVSDPDHERYGKHLTKEEVEALVEPHPHSVAAIDDWLINLGIDLTSAERSPAKDWLSVTVPISVAEKMVNAKYMTFNHVISKRKIVRSLEYSLPAPVSDHIDTIHPTTFFGSSSLSVRAAAKKRSVPSKASSVTATSDPCSNAGTDMMTPACLRHLYRFENYVPHATDRNKLGVVNYESDLAMNSDLQLFFQQFRPDAMNSTFSIQSVGGGIILTNVSSDEASLDVEYALGLTFPTPVTVYSVGSHAEDGLNVTDPGGDPFLGWALFVLNQSNPTQVFTTSYADTESKVPVDYAKRLCTTFAQLGARGISVIFGSGDAGVDNDVDCSAINTTTTAFEPSFPGGCPFLTSVGGTVGIAPEFGVGGPDSPFSNYRGSGGGFSNVFPRPSYQNNAVSEYLKKLGSTYDGLFNHSGRAFPDIAAQSSNFGIVLDGETTGDSGTSASGPVVAAVISLLNDVRLSQGQPPLGFINPWLYSKGFKGLNDVLMGESEGCNGRGFNASNGWDPVTGLGTPDFIKLQKLL